MDDRLENLERAQAPLGQERARMGVKRAQQAKIGVLALQGDFAAHVSILRRIGAEASEVRTSRELDRVDGLILPGGESTTLLRLLRLEGLDQKLHEFHRRGGALFGTCAGLILLAAEVTGPEQESLGILDVGVERNAYGRQVDSFVTEGHLSLPSLPRAQPRADGALARVSPEEAVPLEMVFIRAPRIRRVGKGVEVLGRAGDDAVLVRSGKVVGATFHPEIAGDPRIHAWFCALTAAEPAPR